MIQKDLNIKKNCEKIAFQIARDLRRVIINGVDESLLIGYQMDIEDVGTYQIAYKIRKVKDDEIIKISDKELDELDYKKEEDLNG